MIGFFVMCEIVIYVFYKGQPLALPMIATEDNAFGRV